MALVVPAMHGNAGKGFWPQHCGQCRTGRLGNDRQRQGYLEAASKCQQSLQWIARLDRIVIAQPEVNPLSLGGEIIEALSQENFRHYHSRLPIPV